MWNGIIYAYKNEKKNQKKIMLKKDNKVVSSMVERLVYTEAAESSNPSLPI